MSFIECLYISISVQFIFRTEHFSSENFQFRPAIKFWLFLFTMPWSASQSASECTNWSLSDQAKPKDALRQLSLHASSMTGCSVHRINLEPVQRKCRQECLQRVCWILSTICFSTLSISIVQHNLLRYTQLWEACNFLLCLNISGEKYNQLTVLP